MSEESRTDPNPLQGLVRPWFLPSFALTVAVGIGIFWWTGMLTDSAVAGILAVLVPLVLASFVVRPALSPQADPVARALLGASAVLSFAIAAIPAYQAVHPGEPRLVAELTRSGDAQSLPAGVDGKVLLLVSTRLGGSAEPLVAFRLGGLEGPVEGELKRTTGFARVGRGGTTKVSHDHDADWFEATIPAGAKEVRLERVQGLSSAPLRVEIYRDWIPHRVAWVLSLLILALAAAGEVRLRSDTGAAIAAGAALGFGLVVSHSVTPARPVVPVLWAVVLGGIVGAPTAALLRMAFRRFLPAPESKR